MSKSWVLFVAVAAAACQTEPIAKAPLDPVTGLRMAPVRVVEDRGVKEAIRTGVERWRDALVEGDFTAHFEGYSQYGQAQWLFSVLEREAKDERVPRADELSGQMLQLINDWRTANHELTGKGKGLAALPSRFYQTSWLANVLREDFERNYPDFAYMRYWQFKVVSNKSTEAFVFAETPSGQIHNLRVVPENEIWKVDYGIEGRTP